MKGLGSLDSLAIIFWCGFLAWVAWFTRPRERSADAYFLGGRSIPAWAAALSFMATALSAATFLGVPQKGYNGDLSYLAANLGALVAVAIVAILFVPAFYRLGVGTVYGLLHHRFGKGAAMSAAVTFYIGRVFASGARLFMAAYAMSYLFQPNDQSAFLTVVCIVAMVMIATVYVYFGGIRSVIWTDVCQAGMFVGAALLVLIILAMRIPLSLSEIISTLQHPGADLPSKLTVFKTNFYQWSWSDGYTLPAVIFGLSLLNLGAYGTDQDLAQRMLTCRNAKEGAKSAIYAVLFAIPVTLCFGLVGSLLWIFYDRPDLMSTAAPLLAPAHSGKILLCFMLQELPAGVAGLLSAGLMAAAISSLTSELNAMSSVLVHDLALGIKPALSEKTKLLLGHAGVIVSGISLACFASFCITWHGGEGQDFFDFALSVMVFAYSGLVGVFLCALLTKRGNSISATLALIAGFLSVCFYQFSEFLGITLHWPLLGTLKKELAFSWVMLIASALAFCICILGQSRSKNCDAPT